MYGRPNTIYSDNGTNFVGADNLFKKLDWMKIEAATQVKQIQWIFNPPTAAWWGGWFERMVKSVKDLLKRMLGRASLTRDELATCLCSVAATINERPLTAATEDIDDLVALTPAMFLKGTKMTRFPEVEKVTGKELQARYKHVKKLQQDLQARFRKEYLAELVQKASEKKTPDPIVGDVVLVQVDNKKRVEWPLGRIIQLNPGKDGEPRSAVVKTSKGILRRPLQRLSPLEIPSGDREMSKPEEERQVQDFEEEDTDDDTVLQESNEDLVDEALPEVITRAGRKIKKPDRLGVLQRVLIHDDSISN
ncbi:uncharacterized protein LOC110849008 [Folsomia candida]|uniref:uncharacterized protein LOC110849008 n=1 Tax=Folsomia candida TaxID=158441 RepID=UPI000B8F3279|nr:uncharacterized protein LOC110849008 [Folsomia candida]